MGEKKELEDLVNSEYCWSQLYSPKYTDWVSWTNGALGAVVGSKNNKPYKNLAFKLIDALSPVVSECLCRKPYYIHRLVIFSRLSWTHKQFGLTHMMGDYTGSVAMIDLSKCMMFPGNGERVVNCVLHELIHGYLPKGEQHGRQFEDAMDTLNKRFGCQIVKEVDYETGRFTILPMRTTWQELLKQKEEALREEKAAETLKSK